jgi:hypothetical protein
MVLLANPVMRDTGETPQIALVRNKGRRRMAKPHGPFINDAASLWHLRVTPESPKWKKRDSLIYQQALNERRTSPVQSMFGTDITREKGCYRVLYRGRRIYGSL